jgi:Icc-related predicted phosphoesterase
MAPFRRKPKGEATRIFFAADLHGSEPTFRKFLNAASFYDVDALVFGGDLMGKALVPIVRDGDRYSAHLHGDDHEFDADSLPRFCRMVEVTGFYWKVVDRIEYEQLGRDPMLVKGLFQDRARERLSSWLELAKDRLAGTPVRMYLTGGNDDEPSVLKVLSEADGDHVVSCEEQVVELDGEHTMITVGLSTPTPWDTPREADEAEIETLIEASMSRVPDPARCVFNLHCPPKDSLLDRCPKLDTSRMDQGELPKPVLERGRMVMTSGGSAAVREAIATYQPVVGLHGHIHESAGRMKLGRTPSFNPGSDYDKGILQGVIVSIRGGAVVSYQHTSG